MSATTKGWEHASDCALHAALAAPPLPCNCKVRDGLVPMEPERLAEARIVAHRYVDAYDAMVQIGSGIGGLAIASPEKAEDIRAYDEMFGGGAWTVLDLVDEIDRLRAVVEHVAAVTR